MPTTFSELGIDQPNIDEMVKRLHQNMGESIGNYLGLNAKDTQKIYNLMK